MNLILRFIWMVIRAVFAEKRVDVLAVSEMAFRCLPHDLDINWHMTNSRYHSFMDIGRINHMIRHGGWAQLRAARAFPVLGSVAIRFRRPVKPFQRFTVATRIVSWDDRWLYIEQKIVAGGETASIALCKTLFVGKQGRMLTDDLLKVIGHTRPKPPFTDVLAAQDALDKLLVA